MTRVAARLRRRRGVSAIEFAVVFPVLIAAIFGTAAFGQAFWVRNTLQMAVDDAGRFAMASSTASTSDIRNRVLARTGTVDPDAVDVTVTPVVDGGVTFVTIRARTAVSALTLVGLPAINVEGQTRVPRPA
jgi:Flp pilus assembly protein TadG